MPGRAPGRGPGLPNLWFLILARWPGAHMHGSARWGVGSCGTARDHCSMKASSVYDWLELGSGGTGSLSCGGLASAVLLFAPGCICLHFSWLYCGYPQWPGQWTAEPHHAQGPEFSRGTMQVCIQFPQSCSAIRATSVDYSAQGLGSFLRQRRGGSLAQAIETRTEIYTYSNFGWRPQFGTISSLLAG